MVAVKETATLGAVKVVATVGETEGDLAAEGILVAMAEKAAAAARFGSVQLPLCSRPPRHSDREQLRLPKARVPSRK